MAMFNPEYVTEVLNDILGRRGLSVSLVAKNQSTDRQCGENVVTTAERPQEATQASV